jgi:hypothetical protein
MAHLASSLPRPYFVLGALAVLGLHVLMKEDGEPVSASGVAEAEGAPDRGQARQTRSIAGTAVPAIRAAAEPDDTSDDEIRGHDPIDDPAELALVFSLDGQTYIQLATESRATSTGTPRLLDDDDVTAVIAPVAPAALPGELRGWLGREVVVDGACRARVVELAEVSRVTGDPSNPWDDEDGGDDEARWTIERVMAANVVLAGRLDGCAGTWARAASFPGAATVARIDAPDLEAAARRDLLARSADDLESSWIDQGGEGDWREAADVVTSVFHHPLTDERWVFVQIRHGGGCGDPHLAQMAAYRASAGGSVRKVADLEFAFDHIHELVDLDGDGQPELILGGGTHAQVVDLANTHHASISVPHHYYGCGC